RRLMHRDELDAYVRGDAGGEGPATPPRRPRGVYNAGASHSEEEDKMQGKRTRALDSRGRPVPGLYVRDGRFIAGFNCPQTRRWRMVTLEAETLTEARREREALLAGLRDGRTRAPSETTVAELF